MSYPRTPDRPRGGAPAHGPDVAEEVRARALSVRERSLAALANGNGPGRTSYTPPARTPTHTAGWDRLTNAEACHRILGLLRTGRGVRMTKEAGGGG